MQGYLAQKKPPPRRTLQWPYAQGPMVVLGGWVFLVSELTRYIHVSSLPTDIRCILDVSLSEYQGSYMRDPSLAASAARSLWFVSS